MKSTISFIGSAGLPNVYGGFESFLENCAPTIASKGFFIIVTCDASLYRDKTPNFRGVHREFLNLPANGSLSILHDVLAFFRVFFRSDQIVVLGVSGGLFFPLFKILCDIWGKSLIVNVDGLEWRRAKYSKIGRLILKFFDRIAQRFSHQVIYDNEGLFKYLSPSSINKSTCIAYSGDHVLRLKNIDRNQGSALTICRIEPENNLELLIEGVLASKISKYTIVGNWNHSIYSRALREKNKLNSRLLLLDPIYDGYRLAELRESCEYYLHGHSVGGTNPSLVEMLFYDCKILCFDVEFNRYTSGSAASYFKTALELRLAIDSMKDKVILHQDLQLQYTANNISEEYIKMFISKK